MCSQLCSQRPYLATSMLLQRSTAAPRLSGRSWLTPALRGLKQRGSSTKRLNYSSNKDDAGSSFTSAQNIQESLGAASYAYADAGETLVPGGRCEDLSARISKSYCILESCPWVVPRPLYVLAVASDWLGPDQASLYMVQARTMMQQTNAEMDLVLGMSAVQMSAMRDGVVAFDNLADAEGFSLQLQSELNCQAYVATFDSHELFRIMADVNGVVVHLGDTDFVPTPFQLSTFVAGADSIYD